MGWTAFPIASRDYITITAINELIGAMNERDTLSGPSTMPGGVPYSGLGSTLPISYGDIAFIQDWIEAYCNKFVVSHDTDGTPRTPGYYQNTPWPMPVWDIASLWLTGGVNASGWTRQFPREFNGFAAATVYLDGGAFVNGELARNMNQSGDGVAGAVYTRSGGTWVIHARPFSVSPTRHTAYGRVRAGDYMIPETLNEMQRCLKLLSWTHSTENGGSWGGREVGVWSGLVSGGNEEGVVGWEEAKAVADANFIAHGIIAGIEVGQTSKGTTPDGIIFNADKLAGQPLVSASMGNWGPTPQSCYLDFYVLTGEFFEGAVGDLTVYDDNGTGFIEHKYNYWDTEGPYNTGAPGDPGTGTGGPSGSNPDSSVDSTPLGLLTEPAWCAEPTVGHDTTRGWVPWGPDDTDPVYSIPGYEDGWWGGVVVVYRWSLTYL